jgi:DNA-directed RNA polymerase specialized sigma24 family protein
VAVTWTLTGPAFDDLLAALDADRVRAADKYERIRQRLTKLFEWRGCLNADELTDRTFDRVARRLSEGATITAADAYLFCHGVALNVLREHWRSPARTADVILPEDSRLVALDAARAAESAAARIEHERLLDRLASCLDALPPESRRLVAAYHLRETGQIAARKAIAADLGLPLNALRIRVFRLRQALERCVAGGEPVRGAR